MQLSEQFLYKLFDFTETVLTIRTKIKLLIPRSSRSVFFFSKHRAMLGRPNI